MRLSICVLFSGLVISMNTIAGEVDICGPHVTKEATVDSLRIAAVQYPMTAQASPEAWRAKIEAYVKRAAEGKAGVVLFPELLSMEGMTLYDPEGRNPREAIRKVARELTPQFDSVFKTLSKEYGITIISGSWPEIEGVEVKNVARVYSGGNLLHAQTKNHLTYGEITDYEITGATGNALSFQLPGGITAAIAICFDSEFPNFLPASSGTIPEVIFVPSMTSDDNGRHRVARSASARAVEYHAYVVVTGTVGGSAQDPVFGTNVAQAKVFEPSDKLFPSDGLAAQGQLNADQILFHDLDLKRLRESRRSSHVFPAKILHEAASSNILIP